MAHHRPKQVLGIVGSPRRGGNTEILVDEILQGAEEAGAQIEKAVLSELDIGPCRACYACRKTGECIQKDDMRDLLEKMAAAAVWVIGTPVYWWGPSAQLKAFVDRWFSQAGDDEHLEIFKRKRVILAVPMGDTDPQTGRHVVGMFEDALDYVGASLFASVLAPGAYDKGDVRDNAAALKEARSTGAKAVTG
jgi:multimeric flavodoxin WrbA